VRSDGRQLHEGLDSGTNAGSQPTLSWPPPTARLLT
jgi:hypothetical protein